ncbi:hypothetical protein EKH77_02715 [Streptomyces luteoverticillatus]|uniref:Uncharacterized protein n=1 Tax=Streptomyces luteoverticillatus TaxID=66425 RepID=A0A3Q9FWG0_STRLT|nr:hypothetical protein [Streptomyces luteoverticillatus]AZQ70269.1 hypothetical protein EKH77_02715 [Streptomyces luteoverticillatus]
MRDTRDQRVGVVMDRCGPCYQLRPLGGGKEWEAAPADIEPAPASVQLSARLAEANRASRDGGGRR